MRGMKIPAAMLALVLTGSLAACSGDDSQAGSPDPVTPTGSTAESTSQSTGPIDAPQAEVTSAPRDLCGLDEPEIESILDATFTMTSAGPPCIYISQEASAAITIDSGPSSSWDLERDSYVGTVQSRGAVGGLGDQAEYFVLTDTTSSPQVVTHRLNVTWGDQVVGLSLAGYEDGGSGQRELLVDLYESLY